MRITERYIDKIYVIAIVDSFRRCRRNTFKKITCHIKQVMITPRHLQTEFYWNFQFSVFSCILKMKMSCLLSLALVVFLHVISCDDFMCEKPNQVYHHPDFKSHKVCTDGCLAGCYCKRGYKMNEYDECIEADPQRNLLINYLSGKVSCSSIIFYQVVPKPTWSLNAVPLYATIGVVYWKILFAALEYLNAQVAAFVKKDTFILRKKKDARVWPNAKKDITFVLKKIWQGELLMLNICRRYFAVDILSSLKTCQILSNELNKDIEFNDKYLRRFDTMIIIT